jgi:hypothetical protein
MERNMSKRLTALTALAGVAALSFASLPAVGADTASYEFSAQKKKKSSARSSNPRPAANASGRASGDVNTGGSGVATGGEFSFSPAPTTLTPRR